MPAVFTVLAKLKRLRGTPFDIFARHADRRLDRQLIAGYERGIAEVISGLGAGNHEVAVRIASVPDLIRGYGHVRRRHLDHARQHEAELLSSFRQGRGGV